MANKVDTSGLKRFMKKLYNIQNTDLKNVADKAVEAVASNGADYLNALYSQGIPEEYEMPNGISEQTAEGYSILSTGKDVAFIEFGTGRVGESSNYPKNKQPKSGVPITGEWKYYYKPSKAKRTSRSGREGWYVSKDVERVGSINEYGFTTGTPANSQIIKTANHLLYDQDVKDLIENIVLSEIDKNAK